jgi:hypothetical protein
VWGYRAATFDAKKDASLRHIHVWGYTLEPPFRSDNFEYSLTVDEDVEEVKLACVPSQVYLHMPPCYRLMSTCREMASGCDVM